MYKKYDYFVNSKKMSRKDFIAALKTKCQKVVRTDMITEDIGIDLCAFDEKRFNKNMRLINNGTILIIGDYVFSRKEVK